MCGAAPAPLLLRRALRPRREFRQADSTASLALVQGRAP